MAKLTLGDDRSDAIVEAGRADDSYYGLDDDNGPNIYAPAHADYFAEQKHWVEVDGEKVGVVCMCHKHGKDSEGKLLDDEAQGQRVIKGFAPDECPLCALSLGLFREAKENPEDSVNKKKKELGKEISTRLSYHLVAHKGEYEKRRSGAKSLIKPYFTNTVAGKLRLTEAAFNKMSDTLKEKKLEDKVMYANVVGMPINFERAKLKGKRYAEVVEVYFYPKDRIKVNGKVKPDFSDLGQFDLKEAQNVAAKYKKELAAVLSGRKRATPKKKKGKATRRR